MMNKYLNSDPVPWLTDSSDPAVAYLTKKEICASLNSSELYDELLSSSLTGFFQKNSTNEILGDTRNPDLLYRGSTWFFLLAAEYGYDIRTPFIEKTAQFLCQNSRTADGGFSMMLNPGVPVACRTGDILRAMIKSGVNDSITAPGLQWIRDHQRSDGSWLHCPFNGFCDFMKVFIFKTKGSGLKREYNDSIPGCPVATLSCIRALSCSGDTRHTGATEKGISFLIEKALSVEEGRILSCGLMIYNHRTGYPVMTQYDPLTVMIEAAKTSRWNDARLNRSFNLLMKKQSSSGRWMLENNSRGMISTKKEENRLVTLNVLRLLKLIESRES